MITPVFELTSDSRNKGSGPDGSPMIHQVLGRPRRQARSHRSSYRKTLSAPSAAFMGAEFPAMF
jgi:hypothetical protein